jgi:hypothetical protein
MHIGRFNRSPSPQPSPPGEGARNNNSTATVVATVLDTAGLLSGKSLRVSPVKGGKGAKRNAGEIRTRALVTSHRVDRARLTALPVRPAMDYHDSTVPVPGKAVPALIRPT